MAGRPPLRVAHHGKVVREYLLRRALQLAVLNNVLAANPVRDVLSDRLLTTAEQLRDRAAEAPPDPLAFSDGLYEVIPHAVALPRRLPCIGRRIRARHAERGLVPVGTNWVVSQR